MGERKLLTMKEYENFLNHKYGGTYGSTLRRKNPYGFEKMRKKLERKIMIGGIKTILSKKDQEEKKKDI